MPDDLRLIRPLERPPPCLIADHALFLDFDGTLTEIAPTPELVQVPAGLADRLTAIAERLSGALAIVSGRPIAVLCRFLQPFPGILIGQHGFERRETDGVIRRETPPCALAPTRTILATFVERHPGLRLEDKGGTLALHFRQASDLATECRRLIRRAVIASCGTLYAIEGNMVLEVLPKCIGKAPAINACLTTPLFQNRVPVFIGDDTGDEPGFELVNRWKGISIRVGPGSTAARYRLAGPSEVRDWLFRDFRRGCRSEIKEPT